MTIRSRPIPIRAIGTHVFGPLKPAIQPSMSFYAYSVWTTILRAPAVPRLIAINENHVLRFLFADQYQLPLKLNACSLFQLFLHKPLCQIFDEVKG